VTRWVGVGDGPRGQSVIGFSFEPVGESHVAIRNFVSFSQVMPAARGPR
jgi:hypothetical protein